MISYFVKRATETLLCRTGLTRAARISSRGRTLVLAYHNVAPAGERTLGDASLHLPQRSFAAQLDLLQRTHEVVPLTEAFSATAIRRRRPCAVITFDDAYRGAVTVGVAELARRGLPATIFVAPGLLGGRTFWWDVLAALDGSGLSDAVRQLALRDLGGRDALIREWASARALPTPDLPAHMAAATEEELASAVATGRITLGSHTWSHPNLQHLRPEELEAELNRPLAWLRARFQAVVPWLSYPYGFRSPAAAEAAKRTGYEGAMLIEGGWIGRTRPVPEVFAAPRLNVPAGMSLEGFELRTSGVLAS